MVNEQKSYLFWRTALNKGMTETLLQLQNRTKDAQFKRYEKKAAQNKPRRARYEFLPKKEKEIFEQITLSLLLDWLAERENDNVVKILGWIQDYKEVCGEGMLSAEQKKCLRLPLTLFENAMKVDK